jgi:Fur family zinc uptake transcriptional regulator
MNDNGQPLPARDHDHSLCLTAALARAQERCLARGIRWTGLREQVFRHIATSHKPASAYDLIESLARDGKRLAPISIYRILDVLLEAGLVHRLESRNAFFACMTEHPAAAQTITFVCEDCEQVAEVEAPDTLSALAHVLRARHLQPRNTVIEVNGLCEECGCASQGRT